MRYLNVTLISTSGSPTTCQIMAHENEGVAPAIDWMEMKMAQSKKQSWGYVAAFIFDTGSCKLITYNINRMRARIVKESK
jgi:hypothetical protein